MKDSMTLEEFGQESTGIRGLIFDSSFQPWRSPTDPIKVHILFKKIKVCYTYPGIIILADEHEHITVELTRILSVQLIKDRGVIKEYIVECEENKQNKYEKKCIILKVVADNVGLTEGVMPDKL